MPKSLCSFRRRKIWFRAFSSGLAAVQAVIQTLNPKDHVRCDDVYGGTGRLFRKLLLSMVSILILWI